MSRHGVIYTIRHVQSGRLYVGQTTQLLRKRWNSHKKSARSERPTGGIGRAIAEYCHENFHVEAIICAISREYLTELEKELVASLGAFSDGFNLTIGGRMGGVGYRHKPETRAQIAASKIGNQHAKGVVRSAETRRKMAAAKVGKPRPPEVMARAVATRQANRAARAQAGI